jgi:hypothetical protein
VTNFLRGSPHTLNKSQPERSLLLSEIYIKCSMKRFNYSESPLLDLFYRPHDGLFKPKHVACLTLCMTTWKREYISIIRSVAYNEKPMTPRIISLIGHTLHYCNGTSTQSYWSKHCTVSTLTLFWCADKHYDISHLHPHGTTSTTNCGPNVNIVHKVPVYFFCVLQATPFRINNATTLNN